MSVHRFTEEEDEWLRQNYGKLPWPEIIDYIGTSKKSIIQHCYRKKIKCNRYFSPEEIKYIKKNYGRLTSCEIAKRLKRSEDSVRTKICRLELGIFLDNSDKLHLAEVARLVHRDKETIKKTWTKRGLQITKRGKYWMITEKSLTDVMKANPDLWNATECDEVFFCKYEWFRRKREEDRQKMIKKRWGGFIA